MLLLTVPGTFATQFVLLIAQQKKTRLMEMLYYASAILWKQLLHWINDIP